MPRVFDRAVFCAGEGMRPEDEADFSLCLCRPEGRLAPVLGRRGGDFEWLFMVLLPENHVADGCLTGIVLRSVQS